MFNFMLIYFSPESSNLKGFLVSRPSVWAVVNRVLSPLTKMRGFFSRRWDRDLIHRGAVSAPFAPSR